MHHNGGEKVIREKKNNRAVGGKKTQTFIGSQRFLTVPQVVRRCMENIKKKKVNRKITRSGLKNKL